MCNSGEDYGQQLGAGYQPHRYVQQSNNQYGEHLWDDMIQLWNERYKPTASEHMIQGMSKAGAVPELTASERMIQGMSRAGEDARCAAWSWRFNRY